MVSIQKINAVSFGNFSCEDDYPQVNKAPKKREDNSSCTINKKTCDYIDRRLKEQEDIFERKIDHAIKEQNEAIGKSLVVLLNQLTGHGQYINSKESIENNLIKPKKKERFEI